MWKVSGSRKHQLGAWVASWRMERGPRWRLRKARTPLSAGAQSPFNRNSPVETWTCAAKICALRAKRPTFDGTRRAQLRGRQAFRGPPSQIDRNRQSRCADASNGVAGR